MSRKVGRRPWIGARDETKGEDIMLAKFKGGYSLDDYNV